MFSRRFCHYRYDVTVLFLILFFLFELPRVFLHGQEVRWGYRKMKVIHCALEAGAMSFKVLPNAMVTCRTF